MMGDRSATGRPPIRHLEPLAPLYAPDRGGGILLDLTHTSTAYAHAQESQLSDASLQVAIGEFHAASLAMRHRILLEDSNLRSILFHDGEIKGVTWWTGHHNHLRVRFRR